VFGAMDEKDKVAETLRRLGVEDNEFEDDAADPVAFIAALQEDQDRHDALGLLCIEYFRRNVAALQTVDFFNGSSRLAMTVGGVDFFSNLPDLRSMQELQDAHKIRPQKAT
jgi:hypothetical protein